MAVTSKRTATKATVTNNQRDESSLSLVHVEQALRRLNIAKEGIQLPTIVVVGDQSSGKSSVLESLAGISLPRGQGICTRVPLVMRLQNHPLPHPELLLEFNGKTVLTDEAHVSDAINIATEEIAGSAKGISNTPLTLIVKKNGVADLIMVDLPGITCVPVHGQPDNIYDQIKDIIMEYITPEESIILNVLPATVDFTTCESIRLSQTVDKTGLRTLAVVTKADKSPEGLLEKVSADEVNIGLGYVCVRNRIGNESFEEARLEEQKLFESHSLLSKIDKSIVGIPVLAQKLVQVQAKIKSVMNADDVDFAVDEGIEEVDEVAEEEDVPIAKVRTKRNTKQPVMSQVNKGNQVDVEGSANDNIVMNPQSRAKRNVGLPKHLQKDWNIPVIPRLNSRYLPYNHYQYCIHNTAQLP